MAAVALDLGHAYLVTEHEGVRCAAVDEPERDPRVGGMDERALTLDEEQLSPALSALDDEPLGGAGEKVGNHCVHRDSPPGDRDPGLACGDERRRETELACGPVQLERHGHLPDRAIGADGA